MNPVEQNPVETAVEQDRVQAARRQRLAAEHAAEYVECDYEVRAVLDGSAPCERYLVRSRTDYDGSCRLELAYNLEQAQRDMADGVMSSPSWWPSAFVIDLDTGEELYVDVRVRVKVAAPRKRRARARS